VSDLRWLTLAPFGARVDFDFSATLSDADKAEFRQVFYDRKLLVAPGQRLTLVQQQNVMSSLGPVLRGSRGLAEVSPDDGVLNEMPLAFHSDLAFAPEPFTALSLHAVDVAEGRTATFFVDAVLAARTLPAELRARAAGREAVFAQPLRGETRAIEVRDAPEAAGLFRRTAPLLAPHPVTGETLLLVNENHAESIVGMPRGEGDALLQALFDHLYAPAHRLDHPWRNGDLLVWDNLALQHGRPDLTGVRPRRLQRASVAARSLAEQIPEYFAKLAGPEGAAAPGY
jgi:taurine dioxygenase